MIEVLQALSGGVCKPVRKPDAEAEAYRRMKSIFDQHYSHVVSSGIPAWKENVQWAWDRVKRPGYGEPPEKVGQGIWQLTPAGLALNTKNNTH